MTVWEVAGIHLAASCIAAVAVWNVYLRTGNAAWIDTVWAALVGLGALLHPFLAPEARPVAWGIALAMAAWSYRLSLHLFDRTASEPEDGRYAALRRVWIERHGPDEVPGRFLRFYLLQALLATVLALPAALAARDPSASWSWWQFLSLSVAAVALVGAHLSDATLARFRADPGNRGRVCRDGFWRYSRHPNYFFEILLWTSFALYDTPFAHGTWGWTAPAAIAFFLVRVTGIPATEARALESRGDAYREYIRTTSALVPWFPREKLN